jgi:hypothetical protein
MYWNPESHYLFDGCKVVQLGCIIDKQMATPKLIFKQRKCTCANCQTLNRWDATYKKYLEDYGTSEHAIDFIKGLRKGDKILTCFYKLKKEGRLSVTSSLPS